MWSDKRWKIVRRCGAKHICKSKCTKHLSFRALLEIEMSEKCTLLWREAHLEVNMYKAHHVRTTFRSWDVEKVHAIVARSTFPSQNVQNIPAPDHFWKLRCRKSAQRGGARSTFRSQKWKKLRGSEHFWTLRCRFCVAGAGDSAPCQKWAKREDFVAVSTTTTTTLHYATATLHYTTLH